MPGSRAFSSYPSHAAVYREGGGGDDKERKKKKLVNDEGDYGKEVERYQVNACVCEEEGAREKERARAKLERELELS